MFLSSPATGGRSAWACVLWAAGLLSSSCMYPWDDLRSEASEEALCRYLCATYEQCISAEPGCESACESDLRECPTVQEDALRDCVDELDSECGQFAAQSVYETCVSLVPCYN